MSEVADSVHVLPFEIERDGNTRRFHPSAVETDDGVVLLDVGFPHTVDQLEEGLAEAGYGLDDVELVLLTHHDGDHAAGLAAVLEATDATVLAHAAEAPYVDGREFPIKLPDDQERYPPVPVDVELVGGETIRTAAGPMHLHHTPGHSPGMLVAHLPEAGVLIAADALTAEDGLAGPNETFTPDMDTALDSVEAIGDLEFEQVLCYHGGPVDADGAAVADLLTALRS